MSKNYMMNISNLTNFLRGKEAKVSVSRQNGNI